MRVRDDWKAATAFIGITDLLDQIGVVVWEADPATFAFTYVSRGAQKLLGHAPESWIADPDFWRLHIHPDDRATAVALCEAATSQGMDHDFDYRMVAADGTTRWVRDFVRVETDTIGRAIRLRGVLVDKTPLQLALDGIRAGERRFRAVFESSAAGVVILGLDGKVIMANHATCEKLGFEADELRGRDVLELTHPDDRDRIRADLNALGAGTQVAVRYEARFLHRSGEELTVLLSAAGARDDSGSSTYIVVQLHDVTERNRLQVQLHQASKLEAIGRLAGGIAHDFNNVLTVIATYSDFLSTGLHPRDPRIEDIKEIQGAVAKGAQLTRQLLALGRQQPIEPRLVDVNCRLQDVHKLLRRSLGATIHIQMDLTEQPLVIRIDPNQLEHAIINLALNARDAMPDGGTITVRTRVQPAEVAGSGSRAAVIAVSDTGSGMDEETSRHIFEPFFTTKASEVGSGLGLATVYGMVQQNGGSISVDSAPGRGSTFTLSFPAIDRETTDQ